jgi:hypothetical protein
MATVAIETAKMLKKLKNTKMNIANGSHFEKINNIQHNFSWHMIFLQGFIKFDQDFSEK